MHDTICIYKRFPLPAQHKTHPSSLHKMHNKRFPLLHTQHNTLHLNCTVYKMHDTICIHTLIRGFLYCTHSRAQHKTHPRGLHKMHNKRFPQLHTAQHTAAKDTKHLGALYISGFFYYTHLYYSLLLCIT